MERDLADLGPVHRVQATAPPGMLRPDSRPLAEGPRDPARPRARRLQYPTATQLPFQAGRPPLPGLALRARSPPPAPADRDCAIGRKAPRAPARKRRGALRASTPAG